MRAVLVLSLVILAAGVVTRLFARLPSLDDRTPSRSLSDTEDTRIGAAVAPAVAEHPGLSGVHPLADGQDAFAARVLLARAAERSIDAQYYIWHGDITGTLLFNELRAAADRGVRVRLLQDDNTTVGLDETFAALDAHPNIEVRLFNPLVIRSPRWINYAIDFPRLNRRMHNKSFTVDNQATIIGGRNIGDEYFGARDGGLFIDLDVLAIGSVVGDVSSDFDHYWSSASSYPAGSVLPELSAERVAEIEEAAGKVAESPEAVRYVEAVKRLPVVAQLQEGSIPFHWAPVRMVSDDPAKALGNAPHEGLLIARLDRVLERPDSYLHLVSGYFVPTGRGVNGFTAMADRGVNLNIITNSLEATDVPLVYAGYAEYRKSLLEAGVRLWELRSEASAFPSRDIVGSGGSGSGFGSGSGSSFIGSSGTALHAKTFTVDRERVFIGSFNFDPRSAHLNTELGFVISSPALAQQMASRLEETVPEAAYELRLSESGDVVWIERQADGTEVRHDIEPGTTRLQRAMVSILSALPIEWLL